MSDYDVKIYSGYNPTKRRYERRLKSLKKICKNIKLTKKIKSLLKSVNSRKKFFELKKTCKIKNNLN